MLVKCSKCGGYIPELSFGGPNIHDCKNHIKSNTPFKFMILSKEEVKLIERTRKEKEDYNKMIHEKPTVYTSRSKTTIRLKYTKHPHEIDNKPTVYTRKSKGRIRFNECGCSNCGSFNIQTKGITSTCLDCGNIKHYIPPKIRLSEINIAKCSVRKKKGDVWCADSCIDRDTCPNSAK